MKRTLIGTLALAGVCGCDVRPAPPPLRPTAAPLRRPLGPERLREVFPKVAPPRKAVEFRAAPGIVTVHVRQGEVPVATFLALDLLDDPAGRRVFDGATQKVRGYPAISTSMGGGVAALVGNRFRIEVVSLGPEVTDGQRSRWLEGFDWERLKGWSK